MTRPTHDRQTGFTLIEVLVAILIFSFGLLGFVGLQARAIQYSVSAEDSNRAALLANEIGATILTTGLGTASVPSGVVTAWQTRVSTPSSGGLPNGTGSVETTGNTARIVIMWQATGAVSGAANSKNRYVTDIVVP